MMDDLTGIPGANVAFNTIAILDDWPGMADYIMHKVTDKKWAGGMTWETVPLHVVTYLHCSDTFYWGSSDAEDVTEENFHILEAVLADLTPLREAAQAGGDAKRARWIEYAVSDLFAARVRGERPQGAVYSRRYDRIPEIWPLLNAAGPERAVGPGNPMDIPRP